MTRLLTIILICATAYAHGQTIAPHPRLLGGSRVSRLQAEKAGNTLRYQRVKALADGVLVSGNSEDGMLACALIYQTTGAVNYSTAAIRILTAITGNSGYMASTATPTVPLSSDSGYSYRFTLPNVAFTYDLLYPALTVAQNTQFAGWMMDRADWVWPETNPARAGAWAVNSPSNNYWWGFLSSWLAALAAYGDDVRAPNHLTLARQIKFGFANSAYLDSWGVGGIWAEGTAYGPYTQFEIARDIEAHRTATGEDLTAIVPYVRDSVIFGIQSTSPDKLQFYPIDDQARVSLPVQFDYNRWPMMGADMQPDVNVKKWARFWLDNQPSPTQPNVVNWELIFYPNDVVSVDYTASLPTDFFAQGPGFFSRRSDWTYSATWWGVHSGLLNESHQEPAMGAPLIWKGGWLLANAVIYSASGINDAGNPSGFTINHNTLTFGGVGQYWSFVTGAQGGKVLTHESGPDYDVYETDLTGAYKQPTSTPVSAYVRKIVRVNDIWVVDDRVQADATKQRQMHWQSQKQPVVDGSSFSWDNGSFKLVGTTLTPGAVITAIPVNFGNGGALSSYRTDVVSTGSSGTDRLINVLQVIPLAGGASQATPIVCSTHDVAQVGKWVIGQGRTEFIGGTVSYTYTGTSATEHLLTDLLPNTAYNGGVTTTANGTLRFSMPAGTTTISLTPGTAPAPVDYKALYTAEVAAHLADNVTNAATMAALTGNLAATVGQRDALQKKMDALATALKAVLGIP